MVCTWNMLVGKLDVDDVVSRFSGTVCDFTCAVLHIFTVNIHFTGTFDGQTQTSIPWEPQCSHKSEFLIDYCPFLVLGLLAFFRCNIFGNECVILTCVSGVHDELGYLKGVPLHQPLTIDLHLAGVSDLWLANHDLKWTVGHMFTVLFHTNFMFPNFLWCERDSCRKGRRLF